ncbi:hypothetical protein ACH9EU_01855 [Kocuria sp. M1R5S2]|uniref:hypothetical protein n=1 Tax=Kocuria rhizosphaerae TaxID=3376285 RepID=UPI0037B38857
MRTTTRAVAAAVLAAGAGFVAAAPAQAMEIYDISDATRIAEGAAIEGSFTVSCTAGTQIFVSLNVSQRVSDGFIAHANHSDQWTCEGGEVTLPYQAVAYNRAFDEGPAVVSGFIQECAAPEQFCGMGTRLPLVLINIGDQAD